MIRAYINATTKAVTRAVIPGSSQALAIKFTLTSTGTGAGVSTLRIWVTKDITLTIYGTARFYDDAAGTTNEGTIRTVVAGAMRTFYLKCPSGTSSLVFSDVRNLVRWGDNTVDGWESSTNAASIAGSIEGLTNLTYLRVEGSNTLSGSVAGLTKLTYLNVRGSNTLSGSVAGLTKLTYLIVYGSNTLSGSVAGLTDLTNLSVTGSNTLSGSVAGLTKLTYLYVTGSNTLSGSVAGLTKLTYLYVTGSNTLSGSVAGLTKLTYLEVTGSNTLSGSVAGLTKLTNLYVSGSNTLSGSIAGLTDLTYLGVTGSNTISGDIGGSGTSAMVNGITTINIQGNNQLVDYTSGAIWSLTATSTINPAAGYGYSAEEIDNMLIDMAASLGTVSGKTITLKGSSAARTSASDAAVTTLNGKGWTVVTN